MAEPEAEQQGGSGAPPSQDHGQAAITRRAGIVMAGTLVSRMLGAARDAVIAAFFAIAATDTFFVAWTIPNTLRRLLGEGAVSAAFIPVFSQVQRKDGRAAATRYVAAFSGVLGFLLVLVSVIGIATAGQWATLYGAGYRDDPARFQQLVRLTELVFPYIFFAGVAALGMGALNTVGHFAVPAFAPALLNVVLIAAPFTLVPALSAVGIAPIEGLAIAALIGGALQVLVQLPALHRVGLLPRPRLDFRNPGVRRSLQLMLPLLLGTGVHQVNILLSRLFASYLPTGAQSYLYYGQRVVEIPQGMFAIAIASAALPSMAALHSEGRDAEARDALRFSVRLTLFIAVPASAALVALSQPTIAMLFGRGAFSAGQVEQTADALTMMALGVWAVAVVHPVTRMFHAYGDTRTPVVCAALNLVTFIAVSAATLRRLQHVGIALSSTVATLVQLLALVVWLRRKVGPLGGRAVVMSAARSMLAGLGMGAVVFDLARLGHWERGGNDPFNLLVYLATVGVGVAVYIALAYLLKSPELGGLSQALRRRIRR